MFTKLENCYPDFFSDWYEDVLSIQMSSKTEKKVVMCAGVKDIETLKKDFPDKFSKENGRKRNTGSETQDLY